MLNELVMAAAQGGAMHRLIFCSMLSVFLFISSARAQEVLRLSGFEAPNLTPVAEKILAKAYSELGIRIETVISNPQRALLDAASGKTDGELVRVKAVGADHSSLLRVDVPVIVARTYAYANNRQLRGKSFNQLRHLRVGHVSGARFAAELADEFAEIWTADTAEQLFEMLRRDRVDLVIAGEGTARRVIRDKKLEGVFPLRPSLHEVAFYHYLHEKHVDLVPKIEAVLRRMLSVPAGEETDEAEEMVPGQDGNVLHRTGWS
jgi:ABC-type amino acid transport substrate-binding protein